MEGRKRRELGHLIEPINNPRTGKTHIAIYKPTIGL